MKKSIILFLSIFLFIGCQAALQLAIPELLTTQAPVTSPAPGTYPGPIQITLSSSTQRAEVFYTVDGSQPNRDGIPYINPITLNNHGERITIRAIAYGEDKDPSKEINATFAVEYQGPTAPTLEVADGILPVSGTSYYGENIQVILNRVSTIGYDDNQIRICYTLDGTTPQVDTVTGSLIDRDLTQAGIQSSTITVSPGTASYRIPQVINGDRKVTVKARAYVVSPEGYPQSPITSQTYEVNYNQQILEVPSFSPSSGRVVDELSLSPQTNLNAQAIGAQIQYKITGIINGVSYPNASSPASAFQFKAWDSPRFFSSGNRQSGDSITLTAKYTAPGYQDGEEVSFYYNYAEDNPTPPVISAFQSENGVSYSTGDTIGPTTLINMTGYGDYLIYTSNGTQPTVGNAKQYSAPIEAWRENFEGETTPSGWNGTLVINAKTLNGTIGSGLLSENSSAWFFIDAQPPATPSLNILPGALAYTDPEVEILWGSVADAVEYEITIWDSTGNEIAQQMSQGTSQIFTFPGSGTFSVGLRARDQFFNWSSSDRKNIQITLPVLPAPMLLLPADGDYLTINDPSAGYDILFEWSPIPGASSYKIEIEQESAPATFTNFVTNTLASNTYIHLGYSTENTLRWRVAAVDSSGSVGAFSDYFVVKFSLHGAP